MGLIASFYFFATGMMQIPAGILVDKFGKKVGLIGLLPVHHRHAADRQRPSLTMVYAGSLLAGRLQLLLRLGLLSVVGEYPAGTPCFTATAVINSGSALGMAIGLIAASSLLVAST
ncbi:hypothetical protein M8494_20035 [Serratia ureilytica]